MEVNTIGSKPKNNRSSNAFRVGRPAPGHTLWPVCGSSSRSLSPGSKAAKLPTTEPSRRLAPRAVTRSHVTPFGTIEYLKVCYVQLLCHLQTKIRFSLWTSCLSARIWIRPQPSFAHPDARSTQGEGGVLIWKELGSLNDSLRAELPPPASLG